MGQSGIRQPASTATPTLEVAIFPTALGWMGLVGRDKAVTYLTIGHEDRTSVHRTIPEDLKDATTADWAPEVRDLLERFASGEPVNFRSVAVEERLGTPLRQRILEVTRDLPYGTTVTYGQLAALAGRPGAARAIGTAMSSNRVPLIIPCHRVVAAGGKIGGYSAPQGLSLKRRLLEMESRATHR